MRSVQPKQMPKNSGDLFQSQPRYPRGSVVYVESKGWTALLLLKQISQRQARGASVKVHDDTLLATVLL